MQNSLKTLFEQIRSEHEPRHIAVIGSGGKTSAILKLAEEIRSAGKKVLITTTTRMWLPEEPVAQTAEEAAKQFDAEAVVWAGTILPEEGKLAALPDGELSLMSGLADVVLTEADGSRGFPLKYPGADEPVLPKTADFIILVLGLDCLGKPLREVCHHPERIPISLIRSSEETVTTKIAARLLTDGYLKWLPDLPYIILLNASEREPEEETVNKLIRLLPPGRCVVWKEDGFEAQ